MQDVVVEVARFKAWAQALPPDRHGEWETEYDAWPRLYEAALHFIAERPFSSWTRAEVEAVVFAIARDNEDEYIASEIRERHPEVLSLLAESALTTREWQARWQLANELGNLGRVGGIEERVLIRLAEDEHEYVRRRALGALARLQSPAAEELALRAWYRDDPAQEWARMMALAALRRIGSPQLEGLLRQAEDDASPLLRESAGKVRRGESEV